MGDELQSVVKILFSEVKPPQKHHASLLLPKTHRHRSAFEPNMEWDLERTYNGLTTDS